MFKVGKNLSAHLVSLFDRESSVACAESYAEGNGLLALAELSAAVDIKKLNVFNELSARTGNEG